MQKSSKFIIVVGGVYSGTGKGIACASVALLMKLRGHTVQYIKFDPYLNVNAGLMSPNEHGEPIVTEDGLEADLDLGHIERIVGINVSRKNIYTSGQLYKELIEEQENGAYLGSTVQLATHFSQKVKEKMLEIGKDAEVCLVEIGGTIGDAESFGFYEAIRQLKQEIGDDCLIAVVAPIIWVKTIKEFKTKPLQNAVRSLQGQGLQPEILFCRTDQALPDKLLDKISNLTNIDREGIFEAADVNLIYEVPIQFYNRHVDDLIADKFRLKRNACRIHKYRDLVERYVNNNLPAVNIAVFGKYDNCDEAYISIKEALNHAGLVNDVKVKIHWTKAEELEQNKNINEYFKNIDGAIIPGGFDKRGIEGKIKAIQYLRENKIPFLGICLGLQCAVIEFARNVCKIKEANSLEFDVNCSEPVIHYVEGQQGLKKKSGTMRLGSYVCEISPKTLAFETYGKKLISERHRHRYEVNAKYIDIFAKNGLIVSGINPESGLVEIMELNKDIHPYFIGTQAHPEFKSRLLDPAPLFKNLIKTIINK